MTHKIAKLLLEHADSIADRKTAVQKAVELGMPLSEIEEYLDWLDTTSGTTSGQTVKNPAPSDLSK